MLETDKPFSRKGSSTSCPPSLEHWAEHQMRMVCIWVSDKAKKVSMLTTESHTF